MVGSSDGIRERGSSRERRPSDRHRPAQRSESRVPPTAKKRGGRPGTPTSGRHRPPEAGGTAYRSSAASRRRHGNADLWSAPPRAAGRGGVLPSAGIVHLSASTPPGSSRQSLYEAGLRRVVLHGRAQQEVGIGSDLDSSPAHPAAAASFSSSMERRRVPGSANMPKTLEIGFRGFARSRTCPSGSSSTATLSPCRAPRCSRTSLHRVICPLGVTVNVMATAGSPYGSKALWPFRKPPGCWAGPSANWAIRRFDGHKLGSSEARTDTSSGYPKLGQTQARGIRSSDKHKLGRTEPSDPRVRAARR